jgi:acyl-CoA thioesterase
VPSAGDGYITDYLDVRLAVGRTLAQLDGSPGSGRWAAWCRLSDHVGPHSAADLAVFGDLVMLAFGDALGRPCTGNSLDNSVRVINRGSSDWILLDVAADAVEHGFGHAHAHLWTEEGVLLAIADQTLVLREIGPDGRSQRRERRIVGDEPSHE